MFSPHYHMSKHAHKGEWKKTICPEIKIKPTEIVTNKFAYEAQEAQLKFKSCELFLFV